MDWKEQFDPALDFPQAGAPSIRYAICSTPRSGSHFLGQLLFGTGVLGCPLEYFNRRNLVHWQARADAARAHDLVRYVEGIRTSPNGCFGVKAHHPHLRTLTTYIPIREFVSAFVHIHIVRRDRLAQAISFARAQQTDDWISRGPASGREAVYDGDLIRHCLIEINRQNAGWDYLFHAFGVRPLVVEYEALAADPPGCVRQTATFAGVDLPAETPMPAPRTSRQRDAESESWRDRFIEESQRRSTSWTDLDVLQHASAGVREKRPHWKRWVEAALRV
jgi:LPS sulfotransferase NodH